MRDLEATQMFGRRTIWSIYAIAGLAGGALYLRSQLHRTALLAPIDPSLHAAFIGLGVFIGILIAAIEWDGWRLGIGRVRGGIPTGLGALVCMIVMIGLCGIAGSYVAGQLVEWEAFHGFPAVTSDATFLVTGRHSTRSGNWLELQAEASGYHFSIGCGLADYPGLAPGDRILLPVQTGRGGVQRVTLRPVQAILHVRDQ